MPIQCNCDSKTGLCQIHPKPRADLVVMPTLEQPAPVISAEDKLTLKTLEAESLKAQLQFQQFAQTANMSQQQLQQFAATLFEKHGLKQDEWVLDLSKLVLTPRSKA